MGNQLSRISVGFTPEKPGTIPHNERLVTSLMQDGFQLLKIIDDGYMRRVVFPEGWGLFVKWDRGDIVHADILDTNQHQRYSISWCSKGYDNSARLMEGDDEKVEKDLEYQNGWFAEARNAGHDFIDELNDYACAQRAGHPQDQLDAKRDKLVSMWQEGWPEVPTYKAQTGDGELVAGAITALATTFSKPYTYSDLQ